MAVLVGKGFSFATALFARVALGVSLALPRVAVYWQID